VYNTASFSAIVGGASNTVGSPQSFIGAGFQNNVVPNSTTVSNTFGQSAFIGAGLNNTVAGNFDGIVAGQSNSVSPDNSTIVGGTANTISTAGTVLTNGQSAFIGSGYKNTVSANFAAVVGGYENTATANYGAVSGGRYNIVSGYGAAVPGGSQNVAAGEYSFAAGSSSHAANAGTFVWSDDASDATTLTTTANNQFKARAAGGYFLYSAANLSTGVTLAPGSGSWSSVSDRAAKTAFEDIDDARILAKVAALPVSEWSYSAQGTGIRHLGPMAQDCKQKSRRKMVNWKTTSATCATTSANSTGMFVS